MASLVKAVSVAYAGRDGAHGHAACNQLFPREAQVTALPTFSAVAEATVAGDVAFGVLPIESSLSGPVPETHDLLHASPLSIVDETILRIRHHLLASAAVPLEEIRIVRSHPVALDQCRRLLAAMPWATAVAATTTAEAAAQVAEAGDPTEAAIAGDQAAGIYDLTVVAADVGDHPETYTRFVSIATHTRLDGDPEAWRTAFSFVTDHRPGALHRAIEPFARHGVDLVQLVSRPIPESPWRYRFHAVLAGHPLSRPTAEALAEARSLTRKLKVFGSYPARDGEELAG